MQRIGVTRIGELTHLDGCRVPNFVAVRPREPGRGISYYNGKGLSRSQARAGAMMEALERYSGESCDHEVVTDSYPNLVQRAAAVDPSRVLVPRIRKYQPESPLEWVLGYDLISAEPTYVPLNHVVCPYEPRNASAFFQASTHGLASGNTREEALCHALCEINERDAMALYYTATQLRSAVNDLLGQSSRQDAAHRPSRQDAAHRPTSYALIDNNSLPARAGRVLRRLEAPGHRVYLREMTSDTEVAAIECLVVERQAAGRYVAHGGYGSHPDARVALTRALTEAAQSRLACIQGGREDLPDFAANPRIIEDPDQVYGRGPRKSFDAVTSREHSCIVEDIDWLLRRFQVAGIPQVVAVDLTRPELGIPVVRVVAPHAETWAVFRPHSARTIIGTRARRLLL